MFKPKKPSDSASYIRACSTPLLLLQGFAVVFPPTCQLDHVILKAPDMVEVDKERQEGASSAAFFHGFVISVLGRKEQLFSRFFPLFE